MKKMGKIKNGILGAFSGKVGTVVGAVWNGVAYIRSLPQSVKNPRTPAQLMQRSKFLAAFTFLKAVNSLLRVGWKAYATGRSPINAAMSYTIDRAMTGSYPNYSVAPDMALVSRGLLTPAFETDLGAAGNSVLVKWEDNSGTGSAQATDRALVAVANQSKGEAVTVNGGAARSAGRQEVNVPAVWQNDDLHCYLGFISEDGKEVSNSVYAGSIAIA